MFKRRPRNKNTFLLLQSSERSTGIVKSNNTSLIVHESDTETDELPKEITSVLYEPELEIESDRASTSLIKSLTQKTQSTPKKPRYSSTPLPEKEKAKKNQKSQNRNSLGKENYGESKSYFEQVLRICGATPLGEDSSYLMSEDQTVFSRKLNEKLKESNENIDQFLNAFKKKMENPVILQKMLAFTVTSEDCEIARGPIQEPLLRMLLNVECLQSSLIEILLQKLVDLIVNNEAEEKTHLVASILRQMRFLNLSKDLKIANKLFEIIYMASINIQHEIIFMLPEIISKDEVEEVSAQLIDMLKFDDALTSVIVDAISNIELSQEVRSEVRLKILNRLDRCPTECLPSLVQFILNKSEAEDPTQIINGLRNNLPFTVKHMEIKKSESRKQDGSYLKLTFETFKFSAMTSKQMTDNWLKVIDAIESSDDFRCLDFMILILFYASLHGRKNQILKTIRTKIKSSVLTETHVENTFKILKDVAVDYFPSLLEISSSLLKSIDSICSDFGSLLYVECFTNFHLQAQQSIINDILLHIVTGSPSTVNGALVTLKTLAENHQEILSHHTTLIMGLLVKITDLEPAQIRILIDIITNMVFYRASEEGIAWKDELQMFIRKQLTSSKLDTCKKGMISAIMFGKYAGKKEFKFDKAQTNEILEVALHSCGSCEIKRTFFNDEFATMFSESALCESFLNFWSEKIQKILATSLFKRNLDLECQHFPMSLLYYLPVENGRQIVFPAVDFVIKNENPVKEDNISLAVIPSILKLFWNCEKDSSVILPFFSAAVIMPEMTVYDGFNSVCDEDKKKIIMDCLFLCANYLRECVNAFCVHNSPERALCRLKQLISVHNLIGKHVHQVIDYTPPQCQFTVPLQKTVKKKPEKRAKGRKGKKRKSNSFVAENTMPSTSGTQQPVDADDDESEFVCQERRKAEAKSDHGIGFPGYLRQMDVSCLKLLKAELKFNHGKQFNEGIGLTDVEEYFSSLGEVKLELLTEEALFLLEESVAKCEQILKSKKNSHLKSKSTFSTDKQIAPEKFIADSLEILPGLMKKMKIWSNYCTDLLKMNEGILDGPGMFPIEARDVKLALAAGLKFLADILTWKELEKPTNKRLLADILFAITEEEVPESKNSYPAHVVSIAARKAAADISKFRKGTLVFSGAVSIIKSCTACLDYCTVDNTNKSDLNIAELCLEILEKPWFTVMGARERGSAYNDDLNRVIITYFDRVDDKLQTVKETSRATLLEINQMDNENPLPSVKCVNKRNFPLLYREMCKAVAAVSSDKSQKNIDDQRLLLIWSNVVETMLILINIVKVQTSRINLAALLKHSFPVIQSFIKNGMPAVERTLCKNSTEVLKLLKSLQAVTRYLHSICCHSRITSDCWLGDFVPGIRSECERLTLAVQGVLITNKIPMDCIMIATLKNRDLKGNDILSQETTDDSDSDSDLPADE